MTARGDPHSLDAVERNMVREGVLRPYTEADYLRARFFEACASIRLHRRIYNHVTRELDHLVCGDHWTCKEGYEDLRADRIEYCYREIDFCERQIKRLWRHLAHILAEAERCAEGSGQPSAIRSGTR